MRQTMEDGVSDILSSVVTDIDLAVSRNVGGAELLHDLLNAPWLHALMKSYECLLQFQRLKPSPFLPYSLGLSHEIIAVMKKIHRPSAEARELYGLLNSPHIQALLSSHDSIAQSNFEPVLPPLPEEFSEAEEAMRIVCLVKNNQPLNEEGCRGSTGRGVGVIRSRWSSLRRLTLERLVPARRAWSGEEISMTDSEARLLPLPRGHQLRPFLPRYQSTGSCFLCPQTTGFWRKGLNYSAPSIFSPTSCSVSLSEKLKPSDGAFTGGCSDDYAYPPPPVPAYRLKLPNSPVLYKKGAVGGHSRNIPTPGRTPSCYGIKPVKADTVPSSPATRQQGVSTVLTSAGQHGRLTEYHEESLNQSMTLHYPTTSRPNGYHTQKKQNNQPKLHEHPELMRQCSIEELRSTVQTVATSIEHSTEDVRHLGQKMVAVTEMMTDSVEENAQALNLLVEVVDKLQGLIVASKHPESSPPQRLTQPLQPPPRVSSMSQETARKTPTPYPHHLSSSSSCSSSSSSTSILALADNSVSLKGPSQMIRGATKAAVTFGATHLTGGNSGNGQVRLNNGDVSRSHLDDQYECDMTGCLTTKKKKNNKL